MSAPDRNPRLDELLLERALFGLSDEGERELGEARTSSEALEYELGAAAVAVAVGAGRLQPLSEALRGKLEAGAKAYFAAAPAGRAGAAAKDPPSTRHDSPPPASERAPQRAVATSGEESIEDANGESTTGASATATGRALRDAPEPSLVRARADSSPRSRTNALTLVGWVLAAAAVVALLVRWPSATKAPSPAAQRTQLLARADARKVEAQGQEAFAPGAGGDIVWSNDAQAGVMRLVGAPVNDPKVQQYQLWIFDEAQEHPVDGGVFDVTSSGEVLIPIDAKLRVTRPTLFAITLEKPGGVVVSDRQRIAIVAPL